MSETNMSEINVDVTETQVEGTTPTPEVTTEPTPVSIQALTQAQVNAAAHLNLLKLKYPHLKFVEGSWIQEKDHPYFSNKVRVKVLCPICGAPTERATSDLFTFKACPACIGGVRKANKAAKKIAEATLLQQAKATLAQS